MSPVQPLPCELCGGELRITATLIGCLKCRTVWGRCGGRWVEDRTDSDESIISTYQGARDAVRS